MKTKKYIYIYDNLISPVVKERLISVSYIYIYYKILWQVHIVNKRYNYIAPNIFVKNLGGR